MTWLAFSKLHTFKNVGNSMLVSLTIITEVWLCKTGCSCAETRWYNKKCKSQGICLALICPTEWVTAGTNKAHEVRRKQPSVLDNSKQNNVCIHRSLLLHCRPCHPLPLYEWNGETHTRESPYVFSPLLGWDHRRPKESSVNRFAFWQNFFFSILGAVCKNS